MEAGGRHHSLGKPGDHGDHSDHGDHNDHGDHDGNGGGENGDGGGGDNDEYVNDDGEQLTFSWQTFPHSGSDGCFPSRVEER